MFEIQPYTIINILDDAIFLSKNQIFKIQHMYR